MEVRLAGRLRGILLAGLLVLGPTALTLGVLVWLFQMLDGLLGPAMAQLTGRRIPGLGLLATGAIVFALGLVSRNVIGKRLLGGAEGLVRRVPLARFLYSSTKEVVASLAARPADAFKRVVLLEYPRQGVWSVGFVTGAVSQLAEDTSLEDLLTVFVPTTPNPTSGFLVLVPRGETRELVMTVEQGVRLVISGGIVRPAGWGKVTPSGATRS